MGCFRKPVLLFGPPVGLLVWGGQQAEPALVFVSPCPKIRAPYDPVNEVDLLNKECTMNSPPKSTSNRFLALDLHKHYLVVGGVNPR